MDILIVPFLKLLLSLLHLYFWVVIGAVILSWLITFRVLNLGNRFVQMIYDVLYRLTEPVLRPLRQWLPSFSGLDLSPILLILFLYFLEEVLIQIILKVS